MSHVRSVRVSATGPYHVLELSTGEQYPFPEAEELTVRTTSYGLLVGNQVLKPALRFQGEADDTVLLLNGKRYRDSLLLQWQRAQGITVINEVEIDGYLCGVLPREASVNWPIEALKAQAVVSRSFALANLGKEEAAGFDLTADFTSQVYGGVDGEHPKTIQAVNATVDEVLVDRRGKLVNAYFHHSCGGRTDASTMVWGGNSWESPPSLSGVRCRFCRDDEYYHWTVRLSEKVIRTRLRSAGYTVGAIRRLSLVGRTRGGRANQIEVVAQGKAVLIPAHRFRMAVSPNQIRSTFITRLSRRGSDFEFEGRGWGHGVGLCQVGAKTMALKGYSYRKILAFYYPGSRVQRWHR
ncbi:MAG: SpoIID/LytB domain-containing protein [Elusimicrobia bacterium]|nr:SpoIID/LytB domain-containing protein [Elusimicrobiota bacterium]